MALFASGEGTNGRQPAAPSSPTESEVVAWLRLLLAPEGCAELRAVGVARRGAIGTHAETKHYDPTSADDVRAMAREALSLTPRAEAVYFVLNPIHPDLQLDPSGRSADSADILRRHSLLVDFDPLRPDKNGPSSDDEREAALDVVRLARNWLASRGWPDPAFADSGNGWHLLYRVDLPNDDASRELVRRCLLALKGRFDSDAVEVDRKVFDAPRLCKLYGTLARKGEPSPGRPHRVSRVVEAPDRLDVVPADLLAALAAEAPPDPAPVPNLNVVHYAPSRVGGMVARSIAPADVLERARAYLAGCDPAVSGRGGHDQTFKVACKVGPGFGLDEADCLRLLAEEYNPRCVPPWSEKELRHKVDDAYKVEGRRGFLRDVGLPDDPDTPDGHPLGSNGKPVPSEAPDDPHKLARAVVAALYSHAEGPTLRYWAEEWHRWDGRRWAITPDREVAAEVVGAIKAEFDRLALTSGLKVKPVTTGVASNVIQALRSLLLLPLHKVRRQPTWLGGAGPDPLECLPAANGIVHLPSLIAGRPSLTPPTPRFFSPNALGFDFTTDCPRPAAWLDFLGSLWPDDRESIESLQEWFGYLLTPDTSQQKILLLIGPKRSGKGTIGRVLRALVGAENLTAPTLSGLATPFGLQPLIGKTVALVADARLSARADAQVIVERLLSISGEDAQTIDRKHLTSWTGSLPVRFVLISNELFRLGDASGALPSRMILLRLTRSFLGAEDTRLTAKLMRDLPGILVWAVAGWERLHARGHFLQPQSGKEMMNELDELASPIGAFVVDRCRLGPNREVDVPRLYGAWKDWCRDHGRDHPGDVASFGRNLRAHLPDLRTTQPRVEGGGRIRRFVGVDLLPLPID